MSAHMSITAIRSAGDAIDVTRDFLFGQTVRRYFLLAMMALFLGPAGVSGPPGPIQIRDDAFETNDAALPTLGEVIDIISIEIVLLVLAILGLLAVGYTLLGSLMEFAFVHSLTSETVQLRSPFVNYWRQAVGLFLFRLVLWALVATPLLVVGMAAVGWIDLPFRLALIGSLAFVIALSGYLVNRLTTDFVVPVMLHEECNILTGWQRLLVVMRREWKQYAIYVPVRIMLEIALGIAIGVILGIGLVAIGILIGIPLGLVFFLVLGTLGIAITAGLLLFVAIVAMLLAIVPFHTYLRYYTLLVLGDTDADLDLIPSMRARIRDSPRETMSSE